MEYKETWFGQHDISVNCGGFFDGRNYWLHKFVKVKVSDSEDVLLRPGYILISRNLPMLQESLRLYAEELKEAGAVIVQHTRNRLVARYGNETASFIVKHSKNE